MLFFADYHQLQSDLTTCADRRDHLKWPIYTPRCTPIQGGREADYPAETHTGTEKNMHTLQRQHPRSGLILGHWTWEAAALLTVPLCHVLRRYEQFHSDTGHQTINWINWIITTTSTLACHDDWTVTIKLFDCVTNSPLQCGDIDRWVPVQDSQKVHLHTSSLKANDADIKANVIKLGSRGWHNLNAKHTYYLIATKNAL